MALFGAYRLEEPVGRGGFSEVWRATDVRDGSSVAVKILTGGRSAVDPTFHAALREEARAVAALDHPGVVHLYDQGRSDVDQPPRGAPCLVMEYADAGNLEGWEPEGWAELRDLLAQLLDALAHAHARGVLHLDLKPANILRCGPDHGRPGAKLADFGATSRFVAVDDSQLLGTPRYMSPEQVAGRSHLFGPWTDLYAVGALAFRFATGQAAVPGESLYQLVFAHEQGRRTPFLPRFSVPEGAETWLSRLLAPDWRDRPQGAAEAWQELEDLGEALPPRALGGRGRGRSEAGLVGLRPTPLTGRGRERERLERWITSSAPGARVLVLEGVAGAGRTRLAAWVARRADEAGQVAPVFAAHGGGGRGGVAEALRRVLGLDRAADPRAALAARLGGEVEAAAQALGLAPSRFARVEERWAAWWSILTANGRGRAPLLVLDDAHRDPDALAFAAWAVGLGSRAPSPLWLLVTAQTEGLAERPEARAAVEGLRRADGVTRLKVGPLPEDERLPFLEALLPLEGEAAARVLERAGGNPLHCEQLVASWVEDGTLRPGTQGYRLLGDLHDADSDHTSVSRARTVRALAALNPSARQALALAAVLGDPCDGAEWRALCDRVGCTADGALEPLARAGLLQGGLRQFGFANRSVRDAILESVDDLSVLHAAVVEHLEAAEPDLPRLGRHLALAGRPSAAADALLRAADAAVEASDHRVAAVLLDEHAALVGQAEPLALALRAAAVRGQARFAEAKELAQQALAAATTTGEAFALARAHLELGWCAVNVGRHGEAAERLEQARSMALLAEDEAGAARATRLLGNACKFLGELDAADRWAAEAQERWEALDRPVRAGWSALLRSQVAKQRGDLEAVERWLQEARVRFLMSSAAAGMASVDNGLGELYRLQGRFVDAEPHYRAALAWSRATASSDAVISEANLGLLLLEAGRVREAAELLEGARRTFARQGRGELEGIMCIGLAGCAAVDGTRAGFEAAWERGAAAVQATGFTYYEIARIAEVAAQAADRRGWMDLGRAARSLALEQWTALGRDEDAARVRVPTA